MTEQVDVRKLAEFVWGKDNVKLLWGCTDECEDFSIVPPGYKKEKFDTQKRLCFFDTHWQIAPDFPNDPNACFEHIEPPLYERLGIYHIGFARVKGIGYNCYMNRAAIEYPHREEGRSKELMTLGHGKTLGESFCSAALAVINRYPELEKGVIEQLMDTEREKA